MTTNLYTTAQAVLREYLAPDLADEAAARVCEAFQEAAQTLVAGLVGPSSGWMTTYDDAGHATSTEVRVAVATDADGPEPATHEAAPELPKPPTGTAAFRAKLRWAKRRAADGQPPEPGDAEVLAADAAGEVIDVSAWPSKRSRTRGAKSEELEAPPSDEAPAGSTSSAVARTRARTAAREAAANGAAPPANPTAPVLSKDAPL